MSKSIHALCACSILFYSNFVYAINFSKAKKELAKKVYPKKGETFYCECSYNSKTIKPKGCGITLKKYKKRKYKLEWEHIVPAHAFGQSFKEWREAKKICKKKNGKYSSPRKCAKRNPLFREMEGNIFNLVPSVGSINAYRSNYSFSEITAKEGRVCKKGMFIHNRKAMPPSSRKGDIARIYFYMDKKYPGRGIISRKNTKLFIAWNKEDPVDKKECDIHRKKAIIQQEKNLFVHNECVKRNL